jgi:hypothetical protein
MLYAAASLRKQNFLSSNFGWRCVCAGDAVCASEIAKKKAGRIGFRTHGGFVVPRGHGRSHSKEHFEAHLHGQSRMCRACVARQQMRGAGRTFAITSHVSLKFSQRPKFDFAMSSSISRRPML